MGFIIVIGFLVLIITGFGIEARLRKFHKQNEQIIELLGEINKKS